jgi:hypothetical protein
MTLSSPLRALPLAPGIKQDYGRKLIRLVFLTSLNQLSLLFYQSITLFFKQTLFQKPKRMRTIEFKLNYSYLARFMWIRTHSRHLKCELLLDDRLIHLLDRSHLLYVVFLNIMLTINTFLDMNTNPKHMILVLK